MEIELADVPFDVNQWDVKRAIGKTLHGDDFFNPTDPKDRLINFYVCLHPGRGGVENNGRGILTLGSRKIGDKFLKLTHSHGQSIVINGKKLRFFRSKNKPPRQATQILEKTPYLDPQIEEDREDKLRQLDVGLHVNKIQIGIFYRPFNAPSSACRMFSSEHEISYPDKGAGLLSFDYDHKLIRIQMGDTMTEEIAHNIVITFANIRKLACGLDFGNPYICFDLATPPQFDMERINREITGLEWKDNRKFRQRLDSLNRGHALVAPFAHQLRIIMHEEQDIHEFARLCKVAGIQTPIWAIVEAARQGFFTSKQQNNFRLWTKKFDWSFAFQLEALLRNGLLHTENILVDLRKDITKLYDDHNSAGRAAETLRYFSDALRTRGPKENIQKCFQRVCSEVLSHEPIPLPPGYFACHHVTFTPSRMVMEGPYVIQSNRVIRQYAEFQENFVRVDFRDEDRLQYRWAREVDGSTLLEERVGGILKNGFELGGRYFQFLAYSSSALRVHAVWFVHPFEHPQKGLVTAQTIRDSLGDFSGVIKQPSKYGARLAQAFTATDPSVSISRDQWEEMPDLGSEPYLFTDGVGTISPMLGDMIWEALLAAMPDRRGIKPSAYQIRFLGYKGVVVIDEQLAGIKMRLRPSMNKFKAHDEELAQIEIAQAFDKPGETFLNRPLVTILEDGGVEKEAFMNLQEREKAKIYTSSDSFDQAVRLLQGHKLGGSYRLAYLLKQLKLLGMGFKHEKNVQVLQEPFLDRLIHYAKNHVLREMKHNARIPIPESYLLVGVADEGPAYEAEGINNVFSLSGGEIYACVQGPDDAEPTFITGAVVICRSPVVHPGDVQRVRAIGQPPPDKLCFFRNLKNVVVFPSVGRRSLPSCLGGGDLDGDTYSVIKYGPLLPTNPREAASYESAGTRELDRDSTVDDICDFVVEYINSDVLGLLSDKHIIIADQSKDGSSDPRCIELAKLCSQAVDYPKNGIPVDIHDSPKLLIRYKPDWKKAEDGAPRPTDYYESIRALGELYRAITINPPRPPSPAGSPNNNAKPNPLSDAISLALQPNIELHLHRFQNGDNEVGEMTTLFNKYVNELKFICMTHALSDAPDARLVEEEVAIGTILANCSQHRWRSDRTFSMRLHSSMLVRDIGKKLGKKFYNDQEEPSAGELRYTLSQAWLAWDFSSRNRSIFGASSFGLIALGVIFDSLTLLQPYGV